MKYKNNGDIQGNMLYKEHLIDCLKILAKFVN